MQYVADALIEFASLTAEDVLIDIGCNDGACTGALRARLLSGNGNGSTFAERVFVGRVVLTAAKLTATRGVGIEINETAAVKAQQAVVQGLVDSSCCLLRSS